jgi:hypothetical protein
VIRGLGLGVRVRILGSRVQGEWRSVRVLDSGLGGSTVLWYSTLVVGGSTLPEDLEGLRGLGCGLGSYLGDHSARCEHPSLKYAG